MPVELLLVYALATARLTGLVTTDVITAPLRDRVRAWWVGRRGNGHITYLLGDGERDGCNWCASIWCGSAVAPVAWFWGEHPAFLIPALALAFSQVVGMLGRVGR